MGNARANDPRITTMPNEIITLRFWLLIVSIPFDASFAKEIDIVAFLEQPFLSTYDWFAIVPDTILKSYCVQVPNMPLRISMQFGVQKLNWSPRACCEACCWLLELQ